MLEFGWITQKKVRGTLNVNNILTKAIKAHLLENGCDRSDRNVKAGRNCLYHKAGNRYIIIYTRNESGQTGNDIWAPYEYVKTLAQGNKDVLLLLGILEDDSIKGRFYVLEKAEILTLLNNQNLIRGHYSISENQIQAAQQTFDSQNELNELLKNIIW